MLFTKIAAAAALVATASAASFEYACVKGSTLYIGSINSQTNAVCSKVPLSSATNQWGGGKSSCNKGTWEQYWNISNTGAAWLCYGKTSTCTPRQGIRNESFAKGNGYSKCWSVNV